MAAASPHTARDQWDIQHVPRQESEASRVLSALTEVFLFTKCSQVSFSPNKPPRAARGQLFCLRRGFWKHLVQLPFTFLKN